MLMADYIRLCNWSMSLYDKEGDATSTIESRDDLRGLLRPRFPCFHRPQVPVFENEPIIEELNVTMIYECGMHQLQWEW